MDSIGIDVHKKESQICVIVESTGEIQEKRIATRSEQMAKVFERREKARILMEASTESEWVARCLEQWGHEVIVADPNYAPMYARRDRRVKTDRRDARALAEACLHQTYRPAHRASEEQRRVRSMLACREALVRARTRWISVIRSTLRKDGHRVKEGSAEGFVVRVEAMDLPEHIRGVVTPLVNAMQAVNRQIREFDKKLTEGVKTDPLLQRLCTATGVGKVTATAFRAVVDDPKRFRSAHAVRSYLGLVPREYSSGEKQQRGSITKTGNSRVRSLLVEAAWTILRVKSSSSEKLRQWGQKLASRRGKAIAAVALARRLAGILWAMWRDGTEFQPAHLPRKRPSLSMAA